MADRFDPAVIPAVDLEKVLTEFELAELGQWYWAKQKDEEPLLMCVMEVGSNFVRLSQPKGRSWNTMRVHRDEFTDVLTLEPRSDAHILKMVHHYQNALSENMAEIQRLTENLGVAPQIAQQSSSDSGGKSLALLSGQDDVGLFEKALTVAKKETLPQLFAKNEKLSSELSRWMSAPGMAMEAKFAPLKGSLATIDDRLFNIRLYAGLLDTIFTLSDGEPAARDEKLRIMQRRLYMDEECLLDLEIGGMEFDGIKEFDQWLAKPVNRNRILPFPRCMVSMRIRREVKDRSGQGLSGIVEIREANADKFTYLIIRNGDQLYRVASDQDFGELMFPERATFDPSLPKMMLVSGSNKIERMMTKNEFDSLVERNIQAEARSEKWKLENPEEEWNKNNPDRDWHWSNPHRNESRFSTRDWEPFDDSSTYFDLGMRSVQNEIKEFNRIALVVQGLFDRTATLMPHHRVQMWNPNSFSASVELVYDSSMVLHWGEAPDIRSYIAACNAQVTADSVMYGQDYLWQVREAERQNEKTRNDYRVSSDRKYYYKVLRPYGDNGPGRVAKMAKWSPRSLSATFSWMKFRSPNSSEKSRTQLKASLNDLFNVSAYKLGDYKQFFTDPRTRAKYLEWAPMLLSAEEFHLGLLAAKEPAPDQPLKTRRSRNRQ